MINNNHHKDEKRMHVIYHFMGMWYGISCLPLLLFGNSELCGAVHASMADIRYGEHTSMLIRIYFKIIFCSCTMSLYLQPQNLWVPPSDILWDAFPTFPGALVVLSSRDMPLAYGTTYIFRFLIRFLLPVHYLLCGWCHYQIQHCVSVVYVYQKLTILPRCIVWGIPVSSNRRARLL